MAHRRKESIELLAVSKGFSADAVREACEAGQRAFGENYIQEALDKIELLRDLPLQWHFIGAQYRVIKRGPLQRISHGYIALTG